MSDKPILHILTMPHTQTTRAFDHCAYTGRARIFAMRRGPYKKRDPLERFREKVGAPTSSGCLPWLGALTDKGYGRFSEGGGDHQAHRWIFETVNGPLPADVDVDHRCHNEDVGCKGGPQCSHRACVNLEHLQRATRRGNLRAGRRHGPADGGAVAKRQRAKTHCPRGHPYDEKNTYSPPSRPTVRYCRECHRLDTKKQRAQ